MLDQAPQLRAIKFVRWPKSLIEGLHSRSIRELDLKGFSLSAFPQYFNQPQCHALSRSSLGLQCEVLRIAVVDQSTVFALVQKMANLRVLVVRCHNDPWQRPSTPIPQEDQYLESLRTGLPSTCELMRVADCYGTTRIWIR